MSTQEVLLILNSVAHLHRKDWQWCPVLYHDQIVGGCFTPQDTPFSTSYSHFEAEAIAEKYQRFGIDEALKINFIE